MTAGSLRVEDVGGVVLLVLAGEVDAGGAPDLGVGLSAQLRPGRPAVLDLTDVTFFDSSGVRLVDGLARDCAAHEVPWRVVAPAQCPARRVLELVGMAGPEVVEDRGTALAQLA